MNYQYERLGDGAIDLRHLTSQHDLLRSHENSGIQSLRWKSAY
jgi:hypothetical protein